MNKILTFTILCICTLGLLTGCNTSQNMEKPIIDAPVVVDIQNDPEVQEIVELIENMMQDVGAEGL